MRIAERMQQLAEFGRALKLAREQSERERWPRERLEAYQQERLEALVRHATHQSPFYRERFKGMVGEGPVPLERLPILEKDEMMASYDELVTDRRLRRDEALAWLERAGVDEHYLGRYRVMATSGSSGLKGLFVYDREGWRSIVAQFLRFNETAGISPRLPRRLRIAGITGVGGTHMSRQVSASVSIGLHRVLILDVTRPVAELVERLNGFQPDVIHAYPSIAARLAEEERADRLRIAPSIVTTGSELRTPEMTARLVDAFGVAPFDLYATTEGLWGCECERHEGIHLFEDATLLENVDNSGEPVPPGKPGARLLVTNLANRVQPIIRFAVADAVTIDPNPCPCGRTLLRTRSVEGRSDDVLEFVGTNGQTVVIHPLQFAVVSRDAGVREFQVVKEEKRLRVLVVCREEAGRELETRVGEAVRARLEELGARPPEVSVERRERLQRSRGGKLQIVVKAEPTEVT